MHIAIAGNIGSGKTTLTGMLAKHYGWIPRYESVLYNPYLEDFYKDTNRWAFNLEVYFLKERFKDVLEIAHTNDVIVQDRSIFEGVHVFAKNNHEQGQLTDRDFETFMELFDLMTTLTQQPDLMIYLRCSVPHLVEHIQMRGRDYEQQIPLQYLTGLNERYEDFIFKHYSGRLLVIEADNLDFQHNPADFDAITSRIDGELFGLFSGTQVENTNT